MEKQTDLLNVPEKNTDELLEELDSTKNASSQICTIVDIENLVNGMLSTLPKINKKELRKEMSEMTVPMLTTPTTFSINEGLAKSQAYRDRLSEIYIYAQNDFKIRKRCMEMIFDSVNLISKASSADKRRGEATMRYPTIVLQTEASELFLKEVEQMLSNMKTTMDSISRQASVLNMQIALGEVRRKNTDQQAEEITENSKKQSGGWGNINI